MNKTFTYRSPLATWIERYVAMKQSAGIKGLDAQWRLKELDDFAFESSYDKTFITEEFASRWRASRINDSAGTLYRKYSEIAQFSRFLCRNGQPSYIPIMPKTPAKDFIPYIFTRQQMSNIFKACDDKRMEHKDMSSVLFVMPALLRMLYSTGLRVSEALSLTNADVNLEDGIIMVRKTKNGKERMVPIRKSLSSVLKQYLHYRAKLPVAGTTAPSNLFFIKPNGSSMTTYSVYCQFKMVLSQCGIPHQGNHHGPRVHDLRHTAAVHSLAQMSRAGLDTTTSLPVLSAFLGHQSLDATEKYVRLTAAMYPEIEERLSCTYPEIFPQTISCNEKRN